MICRVCGNDRFHTIFVYTDRDKYEVAANVTGGRSWNRCCNCRLYTQKHSYDRELLYKVYEKDYRAKGFRGESIKDVFTKIAALPYSESENKHRFNWFIRHTTRAFDILDIGSGFGIWPYELKNNGYKVHSTEWNKESRDFIQNYLKIPCSKEPPGDKLFDIVTCVNVLEHTDSPEGMLHGFKSVLNSNGSIFLEVPDAEEFEYLPKNHDEFNSQHFYFFDVPNLYRMVTWVGYKIRTMGKIHYKSRNLKRIYMVADL